MARRCGWAAALCCATGAAAVAPDRTFIQESTPGCKLVLPTLRISLSRDIALEPFRMDSRSLQCTSGFSDGEPAGQVWRVSWSFWEFPPRAHTSGFRLLATNTATGAATAGWVQADENWVAAGKGRLYSARLVFTQAGEYNIQLLYRLESTHFWETWYGERIESIVKSLNNKKNNSWQSQIPAEALRMLSLHHTPLYSGSVRLHVPALAQDAASRSMPLCDSVPAVSQMGMAVPLRSRRAEFEWQPSNCRMRDFGTRDDWERIPSDARVRIMGDSTIQQMLDLGPHLFRLGSWTPWAHGRENDGVAKHILGLTTGAVVAWRYHRGVGCGDGVLPHVDTVLCPSKKERASNKPRVAPCNGFFGINEVDPAANVTRGWNVVFVTSAWWVVGYRRQAEWALYGDGIRRALLDCLANNSVRRSEVSIFWVTPIAVNQSHGLTDGSWRPLWNDRLRRYDAIMQSRLRDLVDGVVPFHAFTAAAHYPESVDVHRPRDYRQLWRILLNYVLWSVQRRARR
eukprot:TRINITY_DN60227_c0_g1_i1.p1 TRINITY_DN60227_c0_g1~~TRINITY_DN60227_c0_g1_i1.p1  ORF type:complete len:538 (+),score=117.70 TRINITY_DN60227_c0_g1_i1:78-1616(+)